MAIVGTSFTVMLSLVPKQPGEEPCTPQIHETDVGERRRIPLPDGSEIELNTDSRVAVLCSSSAREHQLLRGEALFTVAHDPDRPFRVYIDGVGVQAIGTQFNVYRKTDQTTVTVTEGKVRVWTGSNSDPHTPLKRTEITAGSEATLSGTGRSTEMHVRGLPVTVVGRRIAWIDGHIDLSGELLHSVVEQINRYHRQQWVVEPEVRNFPIAGRFRVDDRDTFLALLQELYPVEAHPVGGGITEIRRKRTSPK